MPVRPRSRIAARRRAAPAAAPDPSREAWALIVQFFKVAKQRFLTEFNLTPAQTQLLLQLDPERPMPMIEVATALGCDASNVTGLVDRLEERGLIERRSDSADRRVKMVAVTTAGAKERAKLLDRWYEAPAPIAGLPQRDLRELLRILRKAAAAG
jgi:DNA-binding MarR family transcriptional regulator